MMQIVTKITIIGKQDCDCKNAFKTYNMLSGKKSHNLVITNNKLRKIQQRKTSFRLGFLKQQS